MTNIPISMNSPLISLDSSKILFLKIIGSFHNDILRCIFRINSEIRQKQFIFILLQVVNNDLLFTNFGFISKKIFGQLIFEIFELSLIHISEPTRLGMIS